MYRRVAIIASVCALSGCLAEDYEAPYAIYSADAQMTESCGEIGLLSAPEQLALRIGIRLVGGTGLHWDHGDGLIMGTIDDLGRFSVSRYLRVDLREGDEEQPECVVERTMIVQGGFKGDPGTEGTYETFDANLTNKYKPYDGSSCSDLLEGEERIADELPCTVSYKMDGLRE